MKNKREYLYENIDIVINIEGNFLSQFKKILLLWKVITGILLKNQTTLKLEHVDIIELIERENQVQVEKK